MDKRLPGKYTYLTKEDQVMKQKFKTFKIVSRILYREVQDKDKKNPTIGFTQLLQRNCSSWTA